MFGFGKKKLDDRIIGGIVIELGMFQSWTLEKRGLDLDSSTLNDIIRKILDRENVKYTDHEAQIIGMMALTNTNFDQLAEFRKQTNFDSQVTGFCKSINLPAMYYTPTR